MKTLLLTLLAALAALSPVRAQNVNSLPTHAVMYRIIVNDTLAIRVFDEGDLQTLSRVDAAGNIACSLIGPVNVFGLTLPDAERKIEAAYITNRILRHPHVTVTVQGYAPREVTVTGHVRNPAKYPLPIETAVSLPDIITRAGGFDDTAKGSAVRVTRIGPDGKVEVKTFDVKSVLQGKGKYHGDASDFYLEPNDIVYVPQTII